MEFGSLGTIVASISAGREVGSIQVFVAASFTAAGLLQSHEAPGRYGLAHVRFVWRGNRHMDRGLRLCGAGRAGDGRDALSAVSTSRTDAFPVSHNGFILDMGKQEN